MEETKYPFVSNGLIAYLEKTFPNEYPTKEISTYQLGFGAGTVNYSTFKTSKKME